MNITIVGAGVGGLSTAIALKRRGFEVKVYERRHEGSNIGAGIVCWPNASFALQELGLLPAVAAASGIPVRMQRFSNQGEALGSLDILKLNELMGYPSYSILRKDLMHILKAAARNLELKINYGYGAKKIISKQNASAQILFDNGEIIQTDLVIGADGRMNSITRDFVNGNNRPVYQGFINWIGVIHSEQVLFNEIVVSDYWGVGQRFGVVPISPHTAYWAGAVTAGEIGGKNSSHYRSELLSLFQNWPDPISKIINNTPNSAINKIYVHDHDPMNVWHKNNVLVIGDAAHAPLPTSGQGACQALEDAWHLANLLENYRKKQSPLEHIFKEFTDKRLSKTTGIILGARQFAASLFNTDQDFCAQRNINSKTTNYHSLVEGMAKGWAEGLPLGV